MPESPAARKGRDWTNPRPNQSASEPPIGQPVVDQPTANELGQTNRLGVSTTRDSYVNTTGLTVQGSNQSGGAYAGFTERASSRLQVGA